MVGNGKRKVLVAGGGVAALEAALALRELASDHVSVELLAPEPHFWYQPLAVAEPFALAEVLRFELSGLARSVGADFTPGALTGIDAWRHIAFTSKNAEIPYDMLLVACGALPVPAIRGALTFRGPADTQRIARLLEEMLAGEVRSVAYVIPWGAVWSLPAYELALLTATHLEARGVRDAQLTLVTPEAEPLQLFGAPASEAVRELLGDRGIDLRTGSYAREFADGALELLPEGRLEPDRVVALPRLQGAPIDGIPQTVTGFVPVDAHCRVHGVDDVYAAGDITSFTVKQGGIATQQADAAAEAIAAAAGAPVTPEPFKPVLRGLLLTGSHPRYLRREVSGRPEREPIADYEALWWPPAKIVGRYFAPFLASLAGTETPVDVAERATGTVPVEVELDPREASKLSPTRLELGLEVGLDERRVDDVMSREPLVVAPEDTVGEIAERMLHGGASAAAVAEYGRLIGILTTSDVMRVSAARAHPSDARVRQWMTAEPVTVPADYPALAAELLMTEYGVSHLPVVDSGRPIGMLHARDVRHLGATPSFTH